ncbi:hypothetical protein U1E44_00495 [Arenibacter sp. GZD96]|uniref:hypothetical protein n=1 Tax=Aurantibrevibacter litoralis TaxID=3106030 RepID=UPI002AFEE998|nr:hypothetical protein [Arenibacter sp. GZD-96]MEA1784557.1 hypothetical protein [Arenibacter sp. GZD-96]
MKNIVNTIFMTIGFCCVVNGQAISKDTLFFWYDEIYTIDGEKSEGIPWIEFSESRIRDMSRSDTNGYVYFLKDTIIHDLRPKEILSFKDYLENRRFYYDGKYNTIVDPWKMDNLLLKKHIIFIVKGKEFIKPHFIEYNSYYPVGKGDEAIDPRLKDTLYFKLDSGYLKKSFEDGNKYFFQDIYSDQMFYFRENRLFQDLKPGKTESFFEYLRIPKLRYGNSIYGSLNDYRLWKHFKNYIIFLVGDDCFIKVDPGWEIE